jgi:hypothetical protein
MQTLMLTGMKMIVKLQKGQGELQKGHLELQKGHAELQAELKELAAAQRRTDRKFDRWLNSLKNGSNGHKKG